MKTFMTTTAIGFALATLATASMAQDFRGWNTHPPDYPVSVAMDRFGELVSDRTDGRITLKTYHSAVLGEGEFATEQLQLGALDFGIFSTAPMVNTVMELGVTSLPYAFRSPEHQYRVMEGPIGEDFAAAMAEANMVPLSWFAAGSRSFYASRPLNSIADMAGLKFRVQNSEINVAMVEALGANATPLPYGEVYTALQSGVVDGAENNWPSFESAGHFEVAGYLILDEHTIVPEGIMFAKTTWTNSPPRIRTSSAPPLMTRRCSSVNSGPNAKPRPRRSCARPVSWSCPCPTRRRSSKQWHRCTNALRPIR